MDIKQILKKQIERYIIKNSGSLSKEDIYTNVVKEFEVDRKTVSRYYITLDKNGLLDSFNKLPEIGYTEREVNKVLSQDQSGLSVSMTTETEVKSLEDLLNICEVDDTQWEVVTWKCKKWSVSIKNKFNELEAKDLYSVSASFKPIIAEKSLSLQKDIILNELYKKSPIEKLIIRNNNSDKFAYEISLPDVHFGKFSWKEESGEDYDLKIAATRFNTAISHFLSLVYTDQIDRFILPIGNDLINIDSRRGETTAGTRVDSDTRFFKIVKAVKNILIDNINKLSKIAPVDIVIISGNHDYETMFMIGEILDAYYHNNENITIDNKPSQRKYYKYGKNGFLYTHGNEEKHGDLGLIFATENTKLWAESTACRHIKLGHYHKSKKMDFTSIDEHIGFTIQILPSLSGTDFWHSSRGYMSRKSAKAFLYDKNEGLVAEYNFNLK